MYKLLTLASAVCAVGTVAVAQPKAEMSLLQATLVVSRDVFAQRCPQHIAITDKSRHDSELSYVKRVLTPAAGDNSYVAMRKRVDAALAVGGACDRELQKHKAQTYPDYTYSNITLKK